MTRIERLQRMLKLARQRGDLLAIATLETALRRLRPWREWTEAELREAWGR